MKIVRFKFVLCLLTAAALAPAAAGELSTEKNTEGSVTVTVTPQSLSNDASTWDFNIVLDTHSQVLSDDLAKSALLLDESGGRQAPLAWEGAGPGGHHREGVLRFKAIAPLPRTVELQIQRPNEAAPRTFRWELQ